MSLSKEVWQTLSAIDVSDHIEKKGKLSYLSWAWAYGIMMEHYPELHYSFEDDKCEETGTVEISCTVHIHTGADRDQMMMRHMWLPVMDHRNKAISNPDKFAINTAKMRCLTKCFSMFGLGHYIYAGEDLPEAVAKATVSEDQIIAIKKLLDETKSDEARFLNWLEVGSLSEILASNYDRVVAALEAKKKPMTDDQLADIGKKDSGEILMPKKGWKHSEETKQAMGKYRLGIPLTEEHKNNIRVALSDIQKTPEYRAKMSRALMGVPNPIDGLNGASETNHNCKDWWFIKRGKHYRFRSLNKFVRDNKHLFTDEELTEYRSEKRLAPIYRATVMLRNLHLLKKDGTPKVPNFVWNGWTIGEKWEQGFYEAESK